MGTVDKILTVEGLSLKIDDTQILNDLSLELNAGQVQAVIGPNGSGKSSLASTIMGLDGYKPDSGHIYFAGEDIINLETEQRAQKGVSLAWQHP
ncbi:MAG: ATP-binding cassette domain-containing protein, partial [Bacillota bacterium]